jgi:hypothetical protein
MNDCNELLSPLSLSTSLFFSEKTWSCIEDGSVDLYN